MRSQWTGRFSGERHGDGRGCRRGRIGQDVLVGRDMEMAEVVDEDALDRTF